MEIFVASETSLHQQHLCISSISASAHHQHQCSSSISTSVASAHKKHQRISSISAAAASVHHHNHHHHYDHHLAQPVRGLRGVPPPSVPFHGVEQHAEHAETAVKIFGVTVKNSSWPAVHLSSHQPRDSRDMSRGSRAVSRASAVSAASSGVSRFLREFSYHLILVLGCEVPRIGKNIYGHIKK